MGAWLLAALFACIAGLSWAQSSFSNLEVNGYYSDEGLEKRLKDFVARCPEIASLTSIGTSTEGRTIWALEISDKRVALSLLSFRIPPLPAASSLRMR